MLDQPESFTKATTFSNCEVHVYPSDVNVDAEPVVISFDEPFQCCHAHLFHDLCFRVLQQSLSPEIVRATDIFRLARIKMPSFEEPFDHDVSENKDLFDTQMAKLYTLPREVRYHIYEYIPREVFIVGQAIANVRIHTTSIILNTRKYSHPRSGKLDRGFEDSTNQNCWPLNHLGPYQSLSPKTSVRELVVYWRPPLQGIKYLCGFRALPYSWLWGYEDLSCPSTIKIPSATVISRIELAMDVFGIRKVQLVAKDGWRSKWVGQPLNGEEPPQLWYWSLDFGRRRLKDVVAWFDVRVSKNLRNSHS